MGKSNHVLVEVAGEYSEYCVFSTLFDNASLTTSIKKYTPWYMITYTNCLALHFLECVELLRKDLDIF